MENRKTHLEKHLKWKWICSLILESEACNLPSVRKLHHCFRTVGERTTARISGSLQDTEEAALAWWWCDVMSVVLLYRNFLNWGVCSIKDVRNTCQKVLSLLMMIIIFSLLFWKALWKDLLKLLRKQCRLAIATRCSLLWRHWEGCTVNSSLPNEEERICRRHTFSMNQSWNIVKKRRKSDKNVWS